MFSSKFLLLFAVAAVGLVHAAPQWAPPHWPHGPEHHSPLVGVHYCAAPHFAGAHCVSADVQPSACTNVPPAYNDRVASFAASVGTRCELFEDYDCAGTRRVDVFGPEGEGNLFDRGFGHILSSYKCFKH